MVTVKQLNIRIRSAKRKVARLEKQKKRLAKKGHGKKRRRR